MSVSVHQPQWMEGFFSDWSRLPQENYLRFSYDVFPAGDPRAVAAHLCAESSTAMWRCSDSAEDFRAAHGAKVVGLDPLPDRPGAYRLVIAHPHANFGPRLPNLLAAAAGEGVFYCPGVRTIKLVDIEFPDEYLRHFDGPQFGLAGLRERMAVHDRPFFLGVVKPNLGLAPATFAALAQQAWEGGLDICKDDEMQADTTWSPLARRVECVVAARRAAEHATGERKGFIANITDEVDVMPRLLAVVERAGTDMVMCNPVLTGFSAVRALRRSAHVPIMGHFAGAACWSRPVDFGVASCVITKLMRLAGCDLIGLAGFGPRMQTTIAEVRENIAACLAPMGPIRPALPIPGGGDWAGTMAAVSAHIGHPDFGFIAGRGVFGHPDGPRAGAMSIRQAWEAMRTGQPLTDTAKTHPALAAALKTFGS